jgi:hypothetical protein
MSITSTDVVSLYPTGLILTEKQINAISNWIVPLGKYKGKTYAEMSKDIEYCKWYLTILSKEEKYKNNEKIREYLVKVLVQ